MTWQQVLQVATLVGGVAGIGYFIDRVFGLGIWRRIRNWFHALIYLAQLADQVAALGISPGGPIQPRQWTTRYGLYWGRNRPDEEWQPFCPRCVVEKKGWMPLVVFKLPTDDQRHMTYACSADHRPVGRWVITAEQDRECRVG